MVTSIYILPFLISCLRAATWDYDNIGAWPPLCNTGNSQTPIAIKDSESSYSSDLAFHPVNYDKKVELAISSNGHTVVGTFKDVGAKHVYTIFRNLPYQPVQFHLHWGNDSKTGSEHTLNGKQYPAEIHIVHMNLNYKNLSEALKNWDGLMVIGMFAESENRTVGNSILDSVTHEMTALTYKGSAGTFTKKMSISDMLPQNYQHFTHYNGSLTTPGCQEVVSWIVLKEKVGIPSSLLAKLRMLRVGATNTSAYMKYNYRPVQALNGRTLQRNWKESAGKPLEASALLIFIAQLLYFFFN